MPTFHFQIDARVEVEAADAEEATGALEDALDRGEPQVLLGAMFQLQQTREDGSPVRTRRYSGEEIESILEAHLAHPG